MDQEFEYECVRFVVDKPSDVFNDAKSLRRERVWVRAANRGEASAAADKAQGRRSLDSKEVTFVNAWYVRRRPIPDDVKAAGADEWLMKGEPMLFE